MNKKRVIIGILVLLAISAVVFAINSVSYVQAATAVCSSSQHCSAGGGHGNSGGYCSYTYTYYACDGSCTATSPKTCSSNVVVGSSSSTSTSPQPLRIPTGTTDYVSTDGSCLAISNNCGGDVFVGESVNEKTAFLNHVSSGCISLSDCSSSSSGSEGNQQTSGSGVGYTAGSGSSTPSTSCINSCGADPIGTQQAYDYTA